MRKEKIEIRGYVSYVSRHSFGISNMDMFRNSHIVETDIDRVLCDLSVGDIVSCVVMPAKHLERIDCLVSDLVSIRISDYKAKRRAGSNYFLYPDGYVYDTLATRLAAFVKKDFENGYIIDLKAVDNHDESLYDWYLEASLLDLENLSSDAVTSNLKYSADIKKFRIAIENEIKFRIEDGWGGF